MVAPIPVTPTNAALDAADAAASACADFESLCAAIKNYNHPLSSFANFVPPQFSTTSHQHQPPITIITDLPSSDDDAAGKIMTGAAGELLDKMLSSIGIKRNMVTIIPLLFWRTPGGRTPSREELDLCRPFVNRAIELVDAKKILTLGTLAATEIASAKLPTDHGKVFESRISNFEFRTIPIWHPNYMLLKPDSKRDVWDALQNLQKLLQNA
ncbi:MAG: uracil-DNA glycosylase [Alphaproteobacteria bacterium]|nr:uracil-DNA glycosylase [Alphaproteobacteria bacterium]